MTKSALALHQDCLNLGKGNMGVTVHGENTVRHFSRHLMCPTTGDAYPDPEPNLFSFNSPYGACPQCNGLGEVAEAELSLIIPTTAKASRRGALRRWATSRATGPCRSSKHFWMLPEHPQNPHQGLGPGGRGRNLVRIERARWVPGRAGTSGSHVNWEGVIATIESAAERSNSIPLRRWARRFMQKKTCPSCEGTRLKPISLQFKLGGKNIAELGQMDLATLAKWFQSLDERLTDKQRVILKEPLKEVNARLGFLVDVGLVPGP